MNYLTDGGICSSFYGFTVASFVPAGLHAMPGIVLSGRGTFLLCFHNGHILSVLDSSCQPCQMQKSYHYQAKIKSDKNNRARAAV